LRSVIAFLGLGSNMGIHPADHCRQAIDLISGTTRVRVLRTSSFYRTEPVGFKEQDWFVNAAIEVRTALYPRDLLKALQGVEQTMGRVRKNTDRWGPRVMDIDILLYGKDIVEEEGLFIPHPELHRRRFALVPLAEIASYVIHPQFGVTVKGLLERLNDQSEVIRL
jgi:2-amino-4-hydroxy-6-hydroxymethyldihydropteridine diphosphokinase